MSAVIVLTCDHWTLGSAPWFKHRQCTVQFPDHRHDDIITARRAAAAEGWDYHAAWPHGPDRCPAHARKTATTAATPTEGTQA